MKNKLIIIVVLLSVFVIRCNTTNFQNLDKNNLEKKYYCTSQGFDGKTRHKLVNIKDNKITYSVHGTTGLHTFELTKNEEEKFCGRMIYSTNPEYAFRHNK